MVLISDPKTAPLYNRGNVTLYAITPVQTHTKYVLCRCKYSILFT
jgi:hypothetical protein